MTVAPATQPQIRALRPEDMAAAVALLAQLGYEMSREELERRVGEVDAAPGHALLVAESAGRVAGLMHVFVRPAIENPREAVVQAIVVDRECRRSGIGRSLMAAAERFGTAQDCRSVVLSSNVARAPAHAFYAALGYHVAASSYVLRKELPR